MKSLCQVHGVNGDNLVKSTRFVKTHAEGGIFDEGGLARAQSLWSGSRATSPTWRLGLPATEVVAGHLPLVNARHIHLRKEALQISGRHAVKNV